MRSSACFLLLSFLLLCVAVGWGKSHHHHRAASGSVGAFDSYLLTLSWSPEFCYSHPTDPQCTGGKHLGFVVHGLWPEYHGGRGPENCGTQPGLADPSQMLDIMPTVHLIEHEWTTHGTCTGLSADEYFGLVRKAYGAVKLPSHFAPTESPAQIKQQVKALNGNLTDDEIMIGCRSNYLQEVEICLNKSLQPISCTASQDCRAQYIHIPPVH